MMRSAVSIFMAIFLILPAIGFAADDAGMIVALKGRAVIHRDTSASYAVLKEKLYLMDTVETREASRAKILFRDDSMLTLAEKSRLSIREYLYAEGKKGKSVFYLMDGKLRSLVGGNEFEVHTPTMVVAARGTYFITWFGIEEGTPVSGIAVLEGVVDVSNINPAIVGVVRLERGTMSKVLENKPPAPAMPTPPALLKELIDTTELQTTPEAEHKPLVEEKAPAIRQQIEAPSVTEQKVLPLTPPLENQTPPTNTPVKIRIPIPEGL